MTSTNSNSNSNVAKQAREVLPTDVTPTHYFISYTNIDLVKEFKFHGRVEIDLTISKQETNQILLNSAEIEYVNITVTQNENAQQIDIKNLSYDKKSEQMTIPLTTNLSIGDAKLVILFTGSLNDKLKGFYRSKYTNSAGNEVYCGVTQFEATDARRAFPCWDEPAVKAAFTVEMTIPKELVCISNMPIVEDNITGEQQELRRVLFDKSPVMSSYLLAWIIGEFENVESKTQRGILVRVWTKVGQKSKAEFALKVACRCLDWYEKYFNINYPLPKCDMIAVPDFAAGAMENWGLITYRESALLCEEAKSSITARQWICVVVCHELAHQWFGNLVTMDWWSQLWLNEGFACFMEYLSSDELYPQWRMWDLFLGHEFSRAYELDGMLTSHPIEVEVGTAAQAEEMFDAISYCKGACVIRMLQSFIGGDDFRNGLTKYLNHFQYKNAVTSDLWTFLANESKKDVSGVMASWTAKQGFPLIQATRKGNQLMLTQSRYLQSGQPTDEQNETVWNVPICLRVEGEQNIQRVLLNSRSQTFEIPANSKWIHINAESVGFYCCQYDEQMAAALNNALATKHEQLTVVDRLVLVRDANALAASGVNGATVQLLELIRAMKQETEYPVWSQIQSAAGNLSHLIDADADEEKEVQQNFNAIMRDTMQPIFEDLQWESKQAESNDNSNANNNNSDASEDETRKGLFRPMIIGMMNKYENKETIAESLRRFKIFISDPKANENILDPSLRSTIYACAIKNGGSEEFAALKGYYLTVEDAAEKGWALRNLGYTQDEQLINETLLWLLNSDEVRTQDKVFPFQVIASTAKGKHIAWEFLQNTFEQWYKVWEGGFLVQRLAKIPTAFVTDEKAAEVEKFYSSIDRENCARSMKQCVETIRQNAKWRNGEIKNIEQWVTATIQQI